MQKQFIKPNSHAQVQGRHSVDVVRAICERVGISKDQWLELLFETGCKFVHLKQLHYPTAVKMLTDPAEGFWAYWMGEWIADDARLLSFSGQYNPEYYTHLKNEFVQPQQETILAV